MTQAVDRSERHSIIKDFIRSRDDIEGYGYFRGDREAIEYAQMVGKNQEMKFRKHGIIPKALIMMMGRYWVFQGKNDPVYRNVTYGGGYTEHHPLCGLWQGEVD
ncbi:MAG: hypothetical protein FJ122_11105 [Deltaproteobacteria bacterium]|nr:hypothetical protein [Deltaproteobacteria bacterium]